MRSSNAAVRFIALSLLSFGLSAQVTTGRLEGTVLDSTGSVIPNADVTALETGRQAASSTKTATDGHFVFPTLAPGNYTITVEASGFSKYVLNKIPLTVAATVNEIVKMEVGSLSQSIAVEANTAVVQLTESQLSRAINMTEVNMLPQLNRTPITLAIFQPGVQIDIRAGQDASFSHVNGLRMGSNNSTLDGIDTNDSVVPRLGLTLTANNSDSVQEFRVVTGGANAEYGRNAGAQVNLLTHSGTNEYHGNAFDYLRNTALNANDFFNNQSGSPVPKFIQNIYGGSFEGPIKHDKLFIFGNFQGIRTRQETIRNRTVPTATAKQGIFQYLQGGSVKQYNIAANDPLHIGVDPEVAKLWNQYPAPNNFDVGDGLNSAGFRFNNPTPSYSDQFTIKGDYRPTDKHAFFFRWSWQRNSSIDSLNSADATFPGQIQGTQGGKRWGYAIGYTWTVSPTLINDFRAGYQSATTDFLRPNRPNGPAFVSNLFTDIQFSPFAQGRNSPVIDFVDTVTKVWNNHTIKIGTNVRSTKQYGYNYNGTYPNYLTTVTNGATVTIPAALGLTSAQQSTFQSLYNDVLGRISTINLTYYSPDLQSFQAAGTPRVRNFRLNESGYFIQDDWRATRRLTLNLGLRYEFFGRPYELNGIQGVVNQANLIDGVNQLTGLTISRGQNWYANDVYNFAPRFGFAFDPKGDGKTAIRGFYGIFYDRSVGAAINQVDGNTPGFASASSTFPDQSGADVRYAQFFPPNQPAAPVVTPATNRNTTLFLENPNLHPGYVQSLGLNVQRQLPGQMILQVGYVGNMGVKLFMDRDVNQPRISSDFVTSFNQMTAYANDPSTVVPTSNLFSRVYGSPANTLKTISGSTFTQGNVGTVINTLDRSSVSALNAAGISPFYFRNYPQFNQVAQGTNDGRSYYNSLQVTVSRQAKNLSFTGNYTWSKSMDNISAEGNGFTTPIDSYNVRLNRALSDFDRPHSFNGTVVYSLPIGKGRAFLGNLPRWADSLIGGWNLGSIVIMQSGQPFSILSTRTTLPVSGVGYTYLNYSGTDRSIGSIQKLGNGVFYFTPAQIAQFSFPAAFQLGNSGRNVFRNPAFYETDISLSKSFKITERQSISLRGEAYNLFNHPNFGFTGNSATNAALASANLNLTNPASFGKFSTTLGTQPGTTSARTMQIVARYDF
jgi:hypothetical protein